MRRGATAAALAVVLAGCGSAPAAGVSGVALASDLDGEEIEDVPTQEPEYVPAEAPAREPGVRGAAGVRTLHAGTFRADRTGEGVLTLNARGVGTDWAAPGLSTK
jgi:hypothetical protein